MASEPKVRGVNPILLLMLGLLAGFISGYVVGGGSGSTMAQGTPSFTQDCPYELKTVDNWIIEGFVCPSVACADPLLTCHCEVAHQIKTEVKQQLAQGVPGEQVREGIVKQWGDALH